MGLNLRADAMTAHDVHEWLVRQLRHETPASTVLDAIRTAAGLVPLGGAVPRSVIPASTPATKDTPLDATAAFWALLTDCCALPASAATRDDLTAALKKAVSADAVADAGGLKGVLPAVQVARDACYAQRRTFFRVRIELLRVATFLSPETHPNFHVAEQVVDELFKDGLVEALLEELRGRQKVTAPPLFAQVHHVVKNCSSSERLLAAQFPKAAQSSWELQVAHEEALLRELLLLAVFYKKTTLPFQDTIDLLRLLHTAEWMLPSDVFSQASWNMPSFQAAMERTARLGLMIATRLISQLSDTDIEINDLANTTDTFFLDALVTTASDDAMDDAQSSTPNGVVLLAWATLLAKALDQAGDDASDELTQRVQLTLNTAENLGGFHQLSILLRDLAWHDEAADLVPTNALSLVNLASPGQPWNREHTAQTSTRYAKTAAPALYDTFIFQHVVGVFATDMLVFLGYDDSLHDQSELKAMVKLLAPVYSNPTIAGLLFVNIDHALRRLYTQARHLLPEALPAVLQLLQAVMLAGDVQSDSARHVIKVLSKEITLPTSASVTTTRLLPPDQFFAHIDDYSDEVQVTHAFTYQDDSLQVPVGTRGLIDPLNPSCVRWELKPARDRESLWEVLLSTLDHAVEIVQERGLIQLEGDVLDSTTLMFSLITQLTRGGESSSVISDLAKCVTQARLRRWWILNDLPGADELLTQLARQQVSLSRLLCATREDLAAWGIYDRFTRERVMSAITVDGASTPRSKCALKIYESDGLEHLVCLLLGFLDAFAHDSRNSKEELTKRQLTFMESCMSALAALFRHDALVALVLEEIDASNGECIGLVVGGAKKLFEVCESVAGKYPSVLAGLDVLMSTTRWLLAQEAMALAGKQRSQAQLSHEFEETQRRWLSGAIEFAMDVLGTCENWSFEDINSKWTIHDCCFRLLQAILAASFVSRKSVVYELRELLVCTMLQDSLLLMKLLRCACGVLSSEYKMSQRAAVETQCNNLDFSRKKTEGDKASAPAGALSLKFACEKQSTVEVLHLERLTVTCLQLLVSLLTENGKPRVQASSVLLTAVGDAPSAQQKPLNLAALCSRYLSYPLQNFDQVARWSLKVLQLAAESICAQQGHSLDNRSLVAVYQDLSDLQAIRQSVFQILEASKGHGRLKTEVMQLLVSSLHHQPGFLASLLFGSKDKESEALEPSEDLMKLLLKLLRSSEQLLEQSSELFCWALLFILEVWKGAYITKHALHQKIMSKLNGVSDFWQNLTRCLRIRLAFEDDAEDETMTDINSDEATYSGRSGVYALYSRGIVLQILALEWHYQSANQPDHPLSKVLEAFRDEGLYSHWLVSYTRLSYKSTRFLQCVSHVQSLLTTYDADRGSDAPPDYQSGIICHTGSLEWQLDHEAADDVMCDRLRRIRRANWMLANADAQRYLLAKWKLFMELCCLQIGVSDAPRKASTSPAKPSSPTATKGKRKESMISSPPSARLPPPSPGSPRQKSHFVGDRTSFGMIEVLSDAISACVERRQALDYVTTVHLQALIELLASMLHHQVRVVVQKTQNPKFSQTQHRHGETPSRLDLVRSLQLLRLLERTTRLAVDSIQQLKSELQEEQVGLERPTSGGSIVAWKALLPNFEHKMDAVALKLRSCLMTSMTLLVQHVDTVARDAEGKNERQTSPEVDNASISLLHMKLVEHCLESIKTCDQSDSTEVQLKGELFQVSWCLFLELLNDFSISRARGRYRVDPLANLRPLLALLEHDDSGMISLFTVLVQRFRETSTDDRSQERKAEALHLLNGLVSMVWNKGNQDLCRQVLLKSTANGHLVRYLTKELLPLLTVFSTDEAPRGYAMVTKEDGECHCERTVEHKAWCSLLDLVTALVRLDAAPLCEQSSHGIWEFLVHAEATFVDALSAKTKLTSAIMDELKSILQLLNALSSTYRRQKRWRKELPKNFAVLMECTRLLFRRSCVLIGSSASVKTQSSGSQSPRRQKKVAATTFAHQALLHAHLAPVEEAEKRNLSKFHSTSERKLADVVRQAALALLKWTPCAALSEPNAYVIEINGKRMVDNERSVPLLSFAPPLNATSMSCEPSLGHVCLAIEYGLLQVEGAQPAAGAANLVNICALLFLQTFTLHTQRYDHSPDELHAFATFAKQVVGRVADLPSDSGIDQELFEVMKTTVKL
ncbi:TPA: hypothetical protein N0F65_005056 [Lagenidium giganteum]|uniref:Non-specific serine/threonine protein kinase n=1 Tax=Lagenidium giganteum TaxID=4803 RepID=A0AAV2ZH51_9STRA|nr:TPA: hypothetical protein N0F65_005056 [Lagenidium giganteum]